jgi:hypothetical protein
MEVLPASVALVIWALAVSALGGENRTLSHRLLTIAPSSGLTGLIIVTIIV